jgi:signal transduction histidine kinase
VFFFHDINNILSTLSGYGEILAMDMPAVKEVRKINALEASAEGATVRLATRVAPAHITWEIWNHGFIPADVQKRVFQRHFSTKATFGRGLGTFSMKLFGERYLKGKVSFDSSESDGTTFRFRLPRN